MSAQTEWKILSNQKYTHIPVVLTVEVECERFRCVANVEDFLLKVTKVETKVLSLSLLSKNLYIRHFEKPRLDCRTSSHLTTEPELLFPLAGKCLMK